jgi:superfamily II DNA/RNA helicase
MGVISNNDAAAEQTVLIKKVKGETPEQRTARKAAKKALKEAKKANKVTKTESKSSKRAAPQESSSASTTDDEPSMEPSSKKSKSSTPSNKEFREMHDMEIFGKDEAGKGQLDCPAPYFKFTDAPFGDAVMRKLTAAGYEAPTPIQSQAWPIVMQGRDIISVAKTGSGKTLGFLIPCFEQVMRLTKMDKAAPKAAAPTSYGQFRREAPAPFVVVLAPTRELAMQIHVEAAKFATCYDQVSTVCVYGGESKYRQIQDLQRFRPQVLVGTPGRLNDLTNMGKVSLLKVCEIKF